MASAIVFCQNQALQYLSAKRKRSQILLLNFSVFKCLLSRVCNTRSNDLTRRKLLLTGSPLQNHLMEYYAMIDLIQPDLFDHATFKTTYAKVINEGAMADATDAQIAAAHAKIHLFNRLTNKVVHRKSLAVLATALPNMKEYKIVYQALLTNLKGVTTFLL